MAKHPPQATTDPEGPPPLPARALDLLRTTFRAYLEAPAPDSPPEFVAFQAHVPAEQQANVTEVLDRDKTPSKAYRVALVIQLAYGLEADEPLKLTQRQSGARGDKGVAGQVYQLLRAAHVTCPKDVYQNIGKGTRELDRGNFPPFDNFLRWASQPGRKKEELRAAFDYACRRIAATARPVLPMPELDQTRLTFAVVMSLLRDMLAEPSGGAHEQLIAAALLHAKVQQTNVPGHRVEQVQTKGLTVSDASARAAGDIEIRSGHRVVEAFEVTANPYTEKLPGAGRTIRAHDLRGLHVLAGIDKPFDEVLRELLGLTDDVSVLELGSFIAVQVAELTKASRAEALRRLHEYLDRYQPVLDRVNAYVELLGRHGLTAPLAAGGPSGAPIPPPATAHPEGTPGVAPAEPGGKGPPHDLDQEPPAG